MKPNTPALKDLRRLCIEMKKTIADNYRSEGCDYPSMDLTIGWSPETGTWSYQTGDNSFTGGAYSHPIWAVTTLDRRTNSREAAEYLVDQLLDQVED